MLQHVGCCWLKFEPTTPNMLQHIATRWPNAHNMLRPTMLRYVALACCDRLAGALGFSSREIVQLRSTWARIGKGKNCLPHIRCPSLLLELLFKITVKNSSIGARSTLLRVVILYVSAKELASVKIYFKMLPRQQTSVVLELFLGIKIYIIKCIPW